MNSQDSPYEVRARDRVTETKEQLNRRRRPEWGREKLSPKTTVVQTRLYTLIKSGVALKTRLRMTADEAEARNTAFFKDFLRELDREFLAEKSGDKVIKGHLYEWRYNVSRS
jgi:hypothetical protein